MKARHSQIAEEVSVGNLSNARDLGSARGRRQPRFLFAFAPPTDRAWVCKRSLWRSALILGAVLSLAISVATRYSTVVRHEAGTTRIVASRSLDAKRQHLLKDGLHWSAPAATFVLFEPTGIPDAVLPTVPPIARLYSQSLLFSRPPPSC